MAPPADLGYEIRYATGADSFPVRYAWQRVDLNGERLILGVADPLHKYEGVLQAFTTVLLLSVPPIAILALAGALWLGGRALAPVRRIAKATRAITESNLSARLEVPDSADELQHLSETLNEMLARIEQSFARTRQFTADASHELRAPMTLIYTAAQYSLRKPRTNEELVESMGKILRESRRTTELINDLLTLARGDAGMEEPRLEPLDAARLLREGLEQTTPVAESKHITMILEPGPGALPVRGDDARLRRLLLILLDNALKYTGEGGRVTVRGRAEADGVMIDVIDTGAGIAAEDLPHVFERFWRADQVRSRQAGGTGLGLSIARQIATQHGATLAVSSELGRGSTFTLRMPPA
jgi:heavy metal sensor kinase